MGRPTGKSFESEDGWLILLIVAPGGFVLVGSLLQAVYRKVWPATLVFIGSAMALWFIGFGAQFLFGYVGDKFGRALTWIDLILLLITVAMSVWNGFVDLVNHSYPPVSDKSLDASGDSRLTSVS